MEVSLNRSSIKHHVGNLLAAGGFSIYLVHSLGEFLQSGETVSLLLVMRNAIIVSIFLLRHEGKASGKSIHWVVAILTTVLAFAFMTADTIPLIPVYYSNCLFLIGVTLSCYSVVSLGKSFGIVPANRGIVTRDIYRWVRHPIYASYIIMDIAIVLSAFSTINLLIFIIIVALFFVRTQFEEDFLRGDPQYLIYSGQVKSRFIPGVI